MATLVARDYVLLKIDIDRMAKGKEVAAKLRPGKGGGIPWMVILDGEGKSLVTSDGPDGNVGCPVKPEEIAWFMEMLKRTARKLAAEDLDRLRASLEAYAAKVLGGR